LQATPTVLVNPVSVTYDSHAHGSTGEVFGVGGVDLGPASIAYSSGSAPVNAGVYLATGSFAGNSNYTAAAGTATITIGQAHLLVTAGDRNRVYGAPNPTFTASYAGFIPGEGPTVLGGKLVFKTLATPASDVGRYPVTPGGLTSTNYAITFIAGTLTITKANQTLHWSQPADILFGTALGACQLNATVRVVGPAPAGKLTYTPAAGTVLGPGSHTLQVTAAATTDYNAATLTVPIEVLYRFRGFLPPLQHKNHFEVNHSIPIEFSLSTVDGKPVTNPSAVTSLLIAPVKANGTLGSPFAPASVQRFGCKVGKAKDESEGDHHKVFTFIWDTKGLKPGTYVILLSLADGTQKTQVVHLVK
jgi:MBG domain (YGX type)